MLKKKTDERRKSHRIPVDCVAIEVDSEERETRVIDLCHVLDISHSGMKLKTEKRYEEGKFVTIVFQKEHRRIHVKSKIVHAQMADRGWSLGLKFCDELPGELRNNFDSFLR